MGGAQTGDWAFTQIALCKEAAVRINVRTAAVAAAASALAVAVPAAAHPSPSGHSNESSHSSGSHKCKPHNVGYIVHGTVDPSQATAPAGMLEVNVTRTNHWAKGDRSGNATQPVAYTLGAKTKVKFDGGTSGFTSGERVTLIGKAPVVTNKHCAGAGTVGTPTIRSVVVHPGS
jgi:hypothetical protein